MKQNTFDQGSEKLSQPLITPVLFLSIVPINKSEFTREVSTFSSGHIFDCLACHHHRRLLSTQNFDYVNIPIDGNGSSSSV